MKVTDLSPNGATSKTRLDVESTSPSNGKVNTQMTAGANAATNMNAPELKERSWRTDQLVNMAGADDFTLANETPRMTKMKG